MNAPAARLHLTNGEAACAQLRAAEIEGIYLAWDDPLHQGPVPAGLALGELSRVRARYLADLGWAEPDAVQARFAERDRQLRDGARASEVVLWSTFELYDQLHLLQLLGWFEAHRDVVAAPQVIWVWDLFSGLGAVDLMEHLSERRRVTPAQLGSAADIWQAFRQPEPGTLVEWLARPLGDLPFMHKALSRLLEEYPATDTGLTRTQAQILQVLAAGRSAPGELFTASQALEARPFLGDWSFWLEVEALANTRKPALRVLDARRFTRPPLVAADAPEFHDQVLEITDFGRSLLAGDADFAAENPTERWIGGVKLGADNDWRWDGAAQRVTRAS